MEQSVNLDAIMGILENITEFILKHLLIPSCEQAAFEWEISFFANNEIQHWCHFTMKGLKVKSLHIDG
ncbi:MAG: hypothetical protein ACI9XO_000292 [Paraglaciecola sp.]|jgi:hypothetical protein